MAAAMLIAVTVASAGCGGDDDGGSTSGPETAVGEVDDTGSPAQGSTDATEPESEATDGPTSEPVGAVAGVPDPCTLLTPSAIAAVLGDPAPAGTLTVAGEPPLYLRQCEWSAAAAPSSTRSLYLSVTTTSGLEEGGVGGGGYTAARQFEDSRAVYTSAVDVPGLADGAFFVSEEMGELQALYGDTLLSISSLTFGADARPVSGEELRVLIEVAASNL